MRLRSADRKCGILASSQSLKSKNVRKRKHAKTVIFGKAERKAQKVQYDQSTKNKNRKLKYELILSILS